MQTKAFKRLRFLNTLSCNGKQTFPKFKEIDKKIDYTNLACVHTDRKTYEFNIFRRLGGFIRSTYFGDISLEHQSVDKMK